MPALRTAAAPRFLDFHAYDAGFPEPSTAKAPELDVFIAEGLDAAWRPRLAALLQEGFAEDDVGAALLAVLAQAALAAPGRLPRHAARQLRHWSTARVEPALRARVQATVAAAPALRDAALVWIRRHAAALAVPV